MESKAVSLCLITIDAPQHATKHPHRQYSPKYGKPSRIPSATVLLVLMIRGCPLSRALMDGILSSSQSHRSWGNIIFSTRAGQRSRRDSKCSFTLYFASSSSELIHSLWLSARAISRQCSQSRATKMSRKPGGYHSARLQGSPPLFERSRALIESPPWAGENRSGNMYRVSTSIVNALCCI